MIRDIILRLDCRFTDDDKKKCKPTIHRLLELSNLSRRSGILALETEMLNEQDLFLKTAVELVIDGTDPELIAQILQNLILADDYSGSGLLNRLLIAEGVLALQQGENPRIIALKLLSVLGEGYLSLTDEVSAAGVNRSSKISQFLRTIRDKQALPESAAFEETILQMDDRSIQRVLYGMDEYILLAASCGCGSHAINKLFMNLSLNTGIHLCDDWDTMKPSRKGHILSCQKKILDRIAELESRGEIIVT